MVVRMLGETIGGEVSQMAAEVGQRSLSDRLYWECGNSMTFGRRNWRGNFGNARARMFSRTIINAE